tara:strand:- start:709 stop:1299 length:591 start_codon:yes stop_codon:yes gene_type:complete
VTTVSLNNINTYIINLPRDEQRLASAKNTLIKINQEYQVVEGVEHEQGIVGCGLAHLKIFDNYKPQCLVLEDDICLTANVLREIDIPDKADAIYLGVSNHGYVRRRPVGIKDSVMCCRWDENYKRVLNMCSTHAIVYLTDRYWQACRNVVFECLQKGIAFDLGLASIHRHFNILTPNSPMFYQKGQAEHTNISLEV